MPIVGQQYANGFRPYSSFRVPRSSCGYNNTNNNTNNSSSSSSSNKNNNTGANRTTNKMGTVNGNNSSNNSNSKNNTALSSSCSSSSSLNQQMSVTNGFSRQQPWRSSYCSSNRQRMQEPLQQLKQQQDSNVKPLTPKLIRRIENACASSSACSGSRYGKPRAPVPPANPVRQKANPTTTNQSQKRGYQATNGRCAKENCPAPCRTQRSTKNYPAPLPPQHQQQQQQQQRKQHNDLKMETKAIPLAQRRQLPATPKLSLRQRAVAAAAVEGEGGASSTGSSDSHDSPKLKKAFSKKFPQGLPFEDEFYGCRNRSYSQSSSNYSFYSSIGAPTTPHDDDDDDGDEFQRKPSTDEALYVDFSKVVHSHKQQRQYVPASSWIRASPDHDELRALAHNNTPITPTQQRRKSAKYARSMHEYLYSDDSTSTTTTKTKQRLPVVEEPEDGYYSYAAGTPDPQTPPMGVPKTDIYVAAASWAPKPLYADRVLLPHADTNNNKSNKSDNRSNQQQQQTRRRSEHLGSTTCEYK